MDDNNLKKLYLAGGITGIISGVLMAFTSYWFAFQAGHHDIIHGLGIPILILLVPTLIALSRLLIGEARVKTLLGAAFAVLWIVLELLAHSAQSAPMQALGELEGTTGILPIEQVWQEWAQALMYLGAFLFALMAFCYGLALRSWGNAISAYLFLFAAIVFPVVFFQSSLYIAIRSLAFLFLSGVLMLTASTAEEEWLG